MLSANLGDLAQTLMLRRQTAAVKSDLNRLTEELSSGRKVNLQSHLNGQFTALSGIERSLEINAAYRVSNTLAAQFADVQQLSLETLNTTVEESGAEFLQVASTGTSPQIRTAFKVAEQRLDEALAALNARFAGRALFAGGATASEALVDTQTLLAGLEAAVAAETTAAGVMAAAQAYFDTPAGPFETTVYQGAATPLAPFAISENESVRMETTALDPGIRDALRGLAVAAIMDRGVLGGDLAEQRILLDRTGELLVNTVDDVVTLRSNLGYTQERIEAAAIRSAAEEAALKDARQAMIGADPYETAIRLEEVQGQLQMIYSVTARLSTLSLANVLR